MTRIEKVERFERFTTRGMAEARGEVSMKNIIFLLLLDTEHKVVPESSELHVFGYLSCSLFFILYYLSIIF